MFTCCRACRVERVTRFAKRECGPLGLRGVRDLGIYGKTRKNRSINAYVLSQFSFSHAGKGLVCYAIVTRFLAI